MKKFPLENNSTFERKSQTRIIHILICIKDGCKTVICILVYLYLIQYILTVASSPSALPNFFLPYLVPPSTSAPRKKKNSPLRDTKQIQHGTRKHKLSHQGWGKDERGTKSRKKSQRHSHFHCQKSHKNNKSITIICVHRT